MIKYAAGFSNVKMLCSISRSGIVNDLPADKGKMYTTYYFTYCPYIKNVDSFNDSLLSLEKQWCEKSEAILQQGLDDVDRRVRNMIRFAKVEDLSLSPSMESWIEQFAWCLKQIYHCKLNIESEFIKLCKHFVIFQDLKGEIQLSQSYLDVLLKSIPLNKLSELSSFPVSRVLCSNPELLYASEIISDDGESNNYSTSFNMDNIDKDWLKTFIGGPNEKYKKLVVDQKSKNIRTLATSISAIQYLSGGSGFYFDIRDDKKGSVLLGTWSSGGEIQKTPLGYLEEQEPRVYKAVCDIIDCLPNSDNIERITFACQNRVTSMYSVNVGDEVKIMCF